MTRIIRKHKNHTPPIFGGVWFLYNINVYRIKLLHRDRAWPRCNSVIGAAIKERGRQNCRPRSLCHIKANV